ncbi:TonB-dependent receptor [Myroides odoratus]|uniref:TonB-dependent receptor n=1 Tax=Myroides odoratus TaxID=256 RepID=UPI0039B1103C
MSSFFKITILAVLFFFVENAALAQVKQGVVHGVVVDQAKQPIPGATILIEGTSIGVMSDTKGHFQLKNSIGEATIQVAFLGFETQVKKIYFKEVAGSVLQFVLVETPAMLDDVVVEVKGKVSALRDEAFAVSAIDLKKFSNSTSDLNQLLNKSTGIKVRQQGGVGSDYNFSINGMSGKAVKFFVDGVPLEMLGKGVDMNTLPVNMAKRVEIYKGVVPVHLSTDAMGGAVNIISNSQQADYADVSYTTGSFNTHKVNLNGQFKEEGTGIVLRLNTFFNHSDNDYTMRNMKIWNADKYAYEYKDVKRFNDQYQSFFVLTEFGVVNKKWADQFFVGTSYSLFDKAIQTGSNQDVVYGKVKQKGDANNYFLKYKKGNLLDNRLDINLYAGYSKSLEHGIDTLMRKYAWDGTYTPAGGSEMGGPSFSYIYRDRFYSQLSLEYRFSDYHKINANYTVDYIENTTYNSLIQTKADVFPARMTKQIASLSYQQDFFDKRWTNIFFGKYYKINLQKTIWDAWTQVNTAVKENFDNSGYGVATLFKITDNLGLKASFERSYRLLEPEEIFGDGITITSNMDLKPENSNNYNLGVYYSNRFTDHFIRLEAAGYIRDTKDYIYTVPNLYSSTFKYENLTNIFTKGLEAEFNYQYKNYINAVFNLSYNYAYDNTKYANNSEIVSATYKKEIPNQPWLYGNIDITLGQDDLWQKGSRLEFHWGWQMTEWFYKNWQSYGNKKNIPTIPRQNLHDIGVSYSLANGKYNVAFDCTNVGNALAYDNFRLQKQGRAFYLKFRYSLQ